MRTPFVKSLTNALFCGVYVFFAFQSQSQIFYTNGATLRVSPGGVLFSNGGVELTNNSNFINEGEFTVTKNSTFPSPGNFSLNTLSSVSGNGFYRVEQDWINNALFIGDNSTAVLFGDTEQFITSTNGTITTFNNLILSGNGVGNSRKKTLLNVNAATGPAGILTLNERELSTENQIFSVLNQALNAVTNSVIPGNEGFVSSLNGGYFSRLTNVNGSYLFPTGSSLGMLRYRPLEMVPSAGSNEYSARLNNNSATAEGFPLNSTDDLTCTLNDLYYHSILRSNGNSPADIRFFYLPGTDGNWSHTARWTNPSAQWNDMGAGNPGAFAGFSTLTQTAWNFPTNDHPYVLSTPRPAAPILNCPVICENSNGNIFTASGSTNGYQWNFPAPGTLISGQGSGNTTVNWTSGSGYVSVFSPGQNGGCDSRADSCFVVVYPLPDVQFTAIASTSSNNQFTFIDQSENGENWLWNFGDGNTSNESSPVHLFTDPGTYTVTFTVSNSGGCLNVATGTVTVLDREIFIPNSFTPNTNDINEVWRPIVLNAEKFEVRIFNRWGEQLFSSADINYGWDGTYAGKICPLGVYVYRISVKLIGQREKVYMGNLNLIR